jgi:2-polyprenyl-6-methoxyphenol hydroxylase-like FAD-dependent oxidoreductase
MGEGATVDLETPVLIVGAGPVGLALAGDLGWRGVPCMVVERTDGSILQPRQDLVGIRTMEFCRRWGIVGDVEAAPYPRDYPQDNVYVAGSLAGGWEIGRFESPAMNEAKPPPQSPQRRERCPQNMFDPVLRRFAESTGRVDLRYRHCFVSCEQDPDGVTALVDDAGLERHIRIRARYLAGCDGAGSAVRGQMGTPMAGNPALTYTTNVIFRCRDFETLHPIRRGYRFIFLDTGGTWATLVAINGRDEWRFSIINCGTGRVAPPEPEIHAAIRRAVGRDFDYELLSVVPWVRRELVAERYSDGRVFIAGDSAHVTSPTGGFGMNTGVGDTVDLAWKLDAVLAGWGGRSLLDSYTVERRPVALRNVTEASGNLARMLSPGRNPALLDATPDGAACRTRVGAAFAQAMMREWNTLGIHLGYVYEGSPIVVPDGTPAPPADHAVYVQTARPGSRAPHVRLADGRSTLDLFGRSFVLLALGAEPPDPAPIVAAAASRAMPLAVTRLDDPAVLEAYERPLVLVRPDGHVAWRGAAAPADSAALIDRVRGGT